MPCKNNEQKFRTIVTFGTLRTYKPLTISRYTKLIKFYVIIIVLRLSSTMVTAGTLGKKWMMI